MKQRILQPFERNTTRPARTIHDHTWSLHRLGQRLHEWKLDWVLQGIVRFEKYATSQFLSFRIALDLKEPLRTLELHIAQLERLAESSLKIRRAVAGLGADRRGDGTQFSPSTSYLPPIREWWYLAEGRHHRETPS